MHSTSSTPAVRQLPQPTSPLAIGSYLSSTNPSQNTGRRARTGLYTWLTPRSPPFSITRIPCAFLRQFSQG